MSITRYKLAHTILGAFVALLLMPGIATAATVAEPALQPIHQFIDGMNANDNAKAAAAFADTATFIDEFPPYYWHSATAYADWGASFSAFAKKNNLTDIGITVSAPSHIQKEGQGAYVVIPATFSFKDKGVAHNEAGLMTFTVTQVKGMWKISSMTWSSK